MAFANAVSAMIAAIRSVRCMMNLGTVCEKRQCSEHNRPVSSPAHYIELELVIMRLLSLSGLLIHWCAHLLELKMKIAYDFASFNRLRMSHLGFLLRLGINFGRLVCNSRLMDSPRKQFSI